MQRETVELLVAVACAASSYLVGAFILFFFVFLLVLLQNPISTTILLEKNRDHKIASHEFTIVLTTKLSH